MEKKIEENTAVVERSARAASLESLGVGSPRVTIYRRVHRGLALYSKLKGGRCLIDVGTEGDPKSPTQFFEAPVDDLGTAIALRVSVSSWIPIFS